MLTYSRPNIATYYNMWKKHARIGPIIFQNWGGKNTTTTKTHTHTHKTPIWKLSSKTLLKVV